VVRLAGALAAVFVLTAAVPAEGARHPIHSTLTEITFDANARIATVRVRAFADDFGTATSRWGRSRPRAAAANADSVAFDYLTHAVSLESVPGTFVAFERCGVERTGAVVWLCLHARLERGLAGVRVADRLLNDLFDDEINIVQVDDAGRHASAIYTRKDGARVLLQQPR
jgi:uncharacterized protein DUF6702